MRHCPASMRGAVPICKPREPLGRSPMRPMSTNSRVASRNYAIAQTVLLCAFGGAVLSNLGTPMWRPGGAVGALGLALCAAGLALLFAAFTSLGGAIQIAPAPREGAQLVTRGVYARLRHPIYTAIVVIVVGLLLRKPTM